MSFSSRTASASNATGGSIADQAEELEHVVLHHVAHDAGLLEVAAAPFDADRLGDGELHVVDVARVPQRLPDAVGEAEHQDVLHRLLAEVVIDAIGLIFAQHLVHVLVERARALEIAAERLLDDDARERRRAARG